VSEHFVIYGKHTSMRTFKCMDVNAGTCVGNRIYATVFWNKTVTEMEELLSKLRAENPDWKFEARVTQ
jgi:hypothetical protein